MIQHSKNQAFQKGTAEKNLTFHSAFLCFYVMKQPAYSIFQEGEILYAGCPGIEGGRTASVLFFRLYSFILPSGSLLLTYYVHQLSPQPGLLSTWSQLVLPPAERPPVHCPRKDSA